MISQNLTDARQTEAVREKTIRKDDRPCFHLTPRSGWMNDPNGFSFYEGKYHMFYQYNPYSSKWDRMHWGHAVSSDLLHWEYLPAALAPDEPYDQGGCFSGSAAALPDGRMLLMYTGVRNETDETGRVRDVQTQCIAIGDGTDFEKYEGNPVIDETLLPEGASRRDFRDPKIVRQADGTWLALLGSRPQDGSGQILMYKSADALHWSYAGKLAENHDRYGKMWECPDFFELDGKHVLLVSPQEMLPEGFEFHNGYGTVCLTGIWDGEGALKEEHIQAIDYGIDFYAPQTVRTPDGRQVMIGWLQNWDSLTIREPWEPWAGQMSLPRELFLKDGRLMQRPLRELELLRRDPVVYEKKLIDSPTQLPGIRGRVLEMELVVRPKPMEQPYHRFSLWFAASEEFHTALSYRPYEGTLKIDRKFSGSRRGIIHQRRALIGVREELRLRIVLDRFSAEVFVGEGEQVLSVALYTPLKAEDIIFRCDGSSIVDVKCWKLEM